MNVAHCLKFEGGAPVRYLSIPPQNFAGLHVGISDRIKPRETEFVWFLVPPIGPHDVMVGHSDS
jgi:hypothetical protein